jgi:hypothetical protein
MAAEFIIISPRSIVKQLIIETAKRAVPIIIVGGIVGAVGGYAAYRLVKACRNRQQAKAAPPPPEAPPETAREPVTPKPPRKTKRARRKARPEPA